MEDGESPPLWQPPATLARRRMRWSSLPILRSSFVMIILPSLSLLFFIFIIVPSIPRLFLSQNYLHKPNSPQTPISIKKSWDTLNVVLVVFAILCGVFARRNDDVTTSEERITGCDSLERRKSGDQISRAGLPQWYGYSEQRIYSPVSTPVTGIPRLRRTVSEVPQPQVSEWETGHGRLRFFDDFDISNYYPSHVIHHHYHDVIPELNRTEPETVKEIPVDTFVLKTKGSELPSPIITPSPTPPPRSPAPPPPPPPPPKRTFQTLPSQERVPLPPPPPPKRSFQTLPRQERAPPSPSPPPLPPQSPSTAANSRWGENKKRNSRNRINATKEIANAIASLYGSRKRKRKLKYSKQNYEQQHLVVKSESPPPQPPPPPPPPPPRPPPPSVFHNLFRKGSKTTKIHSLSSIPDPPPPPPPQRRRPANSTGKPPLPTRPVRDFYQREESLTNSGNQSPPLNPTRPPLPLPPLSRPPPPPSPPSFRVADMKFINASKSSAMDGPDEEREGGVGGGTSMSSSSSSRVTCPSPDVNAKADTFIARHHNGWRLEKLNSWREKHNGGPSPAL